MNIPSPEAIAVVIVLVIPKWIPTVSLGPYPYPLTVICVPTVPDAGETSVSLGRIVNVPAAVQPDVNPIPATVVVPNGWMSTPNVRPNLPPESA